VAKVGTSNQDRTISLKSCSASLKIIIIIIIIIIIMCLAANTILFQSYRVRCIRNTECCLYRPSDDARVSSKHVRKGKGHPCTGTDALYKPYGP